MSETVGQCPICGGSNFAGHVCDDTLSSGFVEECRRTLEANEPFITESELENGPSPTNQPNMHSTPMSLTARTCICGHPAHPGRVCNTWVSYRPGALHGFPCACNMNALPTPQSQLESMEKLIGQQQDEIAELRAQLEQERIQHAGCLTAAEGWAISNVPKKGDWAWSPAFQMVLELRAKLEAAEKHLEIKEGAIRVLGSQIQQMQPRAALFPEMLDALKPFAEAELAWMRGGNKIEIRMDWMTAAHEICAKAEALERGTE